MAFISIFNDVLGPVMRGPSSSHTAGAYRIGLLTRDLLGAEPRSARVVFDPAGSMAPTYEPLGVAPAFTCGLMGWSMLDEGFATAHERALEDGVEVVFNIAPLACTDHPNGMLIEVEPAAGKPLTVVAEAVGGGGVRIVRIGGHAVDLDGKSHVLLVEQADASVRTTVSAEPFEPQTVAVNVAWAAAPVFFVQKGEAIFESASDVLGYAERTGHTLGECALRYETELLGMPAHDAVEAMMQRYEVMVGSVTAGLEDDRCDMLLLSPTASQVLEAETSQRLAVGGIHARAAARAMAVMHHCNSRGVVCAAPTGGSAGTVPGVVVSLAEERRLTRQEIVHALFAASAVGLIVARRATFAAEIAGCQVEIGVAGAMAAAAVVEVAGGSAQQAVDAASISLQNTLGSPCDPVAGTCEVPCHTRNAVAASSAFTCADLVLGGYANPIPLDEAIDASYEVGRALPAELRCTARGGCAVTPSALVMPRLR